MFANAKVNCDSIVQLLDHPKPIKLANWREFLGHEMTVNHWMTSAFRARFQYQFQFYLAGMKVLHYYLLALLFS